MLTNIFQIAIRFLAQVFISSNLMLLCFDASEFNDVWGEVILDNFGTKIQAQAFGQCVSFRSLVSFRIFPPDHWCSIQNQRSCKQRRVMGSGQEQFKRSIARYSNANEFF